MLVGEKLTRDWLIGEWLICDFCLANQPVSAKGGCASGANYLTN
jgi:hypothetical protein